jgi:hypothetical protein
MLMHFEYPLMIGGILLSSLVEEEQIPFEFDEISIHCMRLIPTCYTSPVCIHIVQNFFTLPTTNVDTDK